MSNFCFQKSFQKRGLELYEGKHFCFLLEKIVGVQSKEININKSLGSEMDLEETSENLLRSYTKQTSSSPCSSLMAKIPSRSHTKI